MAYTGSDYPEKVYAGILGKIIGVFYGRPVEGWTYERIRDRFGIVDHYVADDVGVPLHVVDDDLSGTFTFFNTLEDFKEKLGTEATFPGLLTAEDFGETWLNYVIENRTIFWWGGLGRSTEHTAYLRLKEGYKAPVSGSAALNGQGVAEQIGAQIFMDALPLTFADDIEKARYYVRACASVSHDMAAVEQACFWAGMESAAFSERNVQKLIDRNLPFVKDPQILRMIHMVREYCAAAESPAGADGIWQPAYRRARDWLEREFSYRYYPGNCHVVPNAALMLLTLIMGGDDFYRAMEMCVSSGWDTDCNGANLGCLNAVRLGLDAIDASFNFRGPVADRCYNVTGDGARCVTDAVRQTRRIVSVHNDYYGTDHPVCEKKFGFDYPGSVQGFTADIPEAVQCLENRGGLYLEPGDGETASASAPVMWLPEDQPRGSYDMIGSPLLYETQTVLMQAEKDDGTDLMLFAVFYDPDDRRHVMCSEPLEAEEDGIFRWKIPQLNGQIISRLGVMACGGPVLVRWIDWNGTPETISYSGSLRNDLLGHNNMQVNAFTASAAQYGVDELKTFVISHVDREGLVTIGTEDFTDYRITSTVIPYLHESAGLAARCKGHAMYYALLITGGREVRLIRQCGRQEVLLAKAPFFYENTEEIRLSLELKGREISARAVRLFSGESEESSAALQGEDARSVTFKVTDDAEEAYLRGGCGFRVDRGTFLADGLLIERV